MEPSFDMVLPHWYLQVHQPSGFFDNCPTFDSEWWNMNCTKEKPINWTLNLIQVYWKMLIKKQWASWVL